MSTNEERLQRAAEDMAAHFNKSAEETVVVIKKAIESFDPGPIWWLMGFTQGWFAAQAREAEEA